MQNLSANRNTRLIAPSAAIAALLAVITLLFFLRSNDQVFAPDDKKPDEISANYSELLLQQTPGNTELRLSLIDLYLGLARFEEAQRHWHLLQNVSADLKKYYQFNIAAQKALGLGQIEQYFLLHERLQNFNFDFLTTAQQVNLAQLALQLDAAPVAARIYEHLANTYQGQQQIEYFERAAKWYFAGNQHQQSARLNALLAEKSTGLQRIHYQRRVVTDYLAGNNPVAAVSYLQQLIKQSELSGQKLSSEQLSEAVSAALLAQDLEQALYFNSLLIAQNPESLEARLAELQISLAAGDIERAWQLRCWLLEHQPDNVEAHIQMAQLGEWNNAFPEALSLWIKVLELQYNAEHYEHAWRLALQIFDFDRGLQLLQPIAERRQLTDIELQAVFYAHESLGTPEEAEQWFRDYIGQYPHHRLGWTYLLQKLENTEQYSQGVVVWESMNKHFNLTSKELQRWAETHLFNYDAEGAWQVFNQDNSQQIVDADYWHLKALVAWELEDDEQLLLAFQHMKQNNIDLQRGEVEQLIGLLVQSNPEKALELTLQRWEKMGNEQDLFNAVYLALDLKKWQVLQQLIDAADDDMKSAQSQPVLLARASLAWHQLNYQLTESILQQAIGLYPLDNLFGEQLLWLYIATDQRDSIKGLLSQWRSMAENDSRLWLAFAAANQLLNRSTEALLWYQRHLELNPSDWLSKAAFADALESAEYYDSALKLRRTLLAAPLLNAATEESYRTWLYLLSANYGQKTARDQALAWQDGTQSMLQLWFEQQLMLLSQLQQGQQKTFWLTWAQQNKLIVSDYDKIEEALRSFNLREIQRLLVSQHLPVEQQVAALDALNYRHRAAALARSALGDEHSVNSREQLRRQVVEELKSYPQGAQIGWQERDFGGTVYAGVEFSVARAVSDRWYARVDADQGQLKIKDKDKGTFGLSKEEYVQLALNRQLGTGSVDLNINHSNSDVKSRTGVSIARSWQVTQKSNLSLGYDWRDRSDASGLMYGLGQENRMWLRGYQQISARNSFSWSLENTDYETRYKEKLGRGKGFELQLAHVVFFEHPTWLVKAGFDYQSNELNKKDLSQLPLNPLDGKPFSSDALLSEKYKYAYLGTTLKRGSPGFLNRTEPQYTWLLDGVIGRQWPDSKMTYSLSAGIGVRVLGDDELAFTFAYQSAPKSQFKSQSGATLGLSYSLRFGR